MKKENTFKILKTGNFYFPIIDKDKKFIVRETIDIELKKHYFELQDIYIKNKTIDFKLYAEAIWEELKPRIKGKKEYKDCWIVPLKIDFLGDKIIATVDVLKSVKS